MQSDFVNTKTDCISKKKHVFVILERLFDSKVQNLEHHSPDSKMERIPLNKIARSISQTTALPKYMKLGQNIDSGQYILIRIRPCL